jgi:hypothetical protein
MSGMAQFFILVAVDVAGLFAIWFALKVRVDRRLELDSLLSGVREEARALVTELNETADRNVSLVEDRVKSLRELLDETDRRMGLVRRELRTRESEREVFARLSARRPIVPSTPDAASASVPAPAPRIAADHPAATAAPAAAAPLREAEGAIEFSLGPREAERRPERPSGRADLPEVGVSEDRIEVAKSSRERAVELHRQGFSAQVIAAKVGATVAEIELMIEMEEMRPQAR